LDVYESETVRGGHAIALVGYTSDRFIVRNSWGTQTWGDKGFGYASFSYAQAAFTEAYGVSV
jgi:C1A family cysteine protease